jgi:hypothetical protein
MSSRPAEERPTASTMASTSGTAENAAARPSMPMSIASRGRSNNPSV